MAAYRDRQGRFRSLGPEFIELSKQEKARKAHGKTLRGTVETFDVRLRALEKHKDFDHLRGSMLQAYNETARFCGVLHETNLRLQQEIAELRAHLKTVEDRLIVRHI